MFARLAHFPNVLALLYLFLLNMSIKSRLSFRLLYFFIPAAPGTITSSAIISFFLLSQHVYHNTYDSSSYYTRHEDIRQIHILFPSLYTQKGTVNAAPFYFIRYTYGYHPSDDMPPDVPDILREALAALYDNVQSHTGIVPQTCSNLVD